MTLYSYNKLYFLFFSKNIILRPSAYLAYKNKQNQFVNHAITIEGPPIFAVSGEPVPDSYCSYLSSL